MKSIFFFFAATLLSCQSKTQTVQKGDTATSTQPMMHAAVYRPDMVDNRKDPSCGMPVTAGIEDTCHYGGKVYGFCSKECKEEFLKNASASQKPK